MVQGILGRKLGMTQVFKSSGEAEAVTAIEAGPCFITQVKTKAKDGYNAVQLAFGQAKRVNSARKGLLKELGQLKYLRELRVDDAAAVKVGDKIDASLFKAGDIVDVIGISKGKGFAGVVKRHHFSGGPKTHGQSDRLRAPGAIGGSSNPGHVFKGKRMAGRMGDAQVTQRNLEISEADPERNLILVKGAVPGANNGLVIIKKAAGGKK